MKNTKIDLLVLPSVENIDEITKDISVNLTKAFYTSIEFRFKNNQVSILQKGRDLKTFSLVWLSSYWASRDLANAVKLYLDSHDIPSTYVEEATSKLTDNMSFALAELPLPDTYYVEDSVILEHLGDVESVCGYPMIMKDSKGCGGKNSALIRSRKELIENVKTRDSSRKYMFQRYIENDYDWGVMVVNNKVVSGEKSYAKNGDFRNNTCVGAKEVFVDVSEIPEDVKEMALLGSRSLGLSWSRADIVVDKTSGVVSLLEVNRFPGITSGSTEVIGAKEFLNNYLEMYNLKQLENDKALELLDLDVLPTT